jgi:hypothetical protein
MRIIQRFPGVVARPEQHKARRLAGFVFGFVFFVFGCGGTQPSLFAVLRPENWRAIRM